MKKAFTMIELIFVIVIIGILATYAMPKLGSSKTQADTVNGRADVSAIRTAIVNERQSRLILGKSSYITTLDNSATEDVGGEKIFDSNGTHSLLTYGITTKTSDGGWLKTGTNEYTYKVGGISTVFTYDPNDMGKFLCDTSDVTFGATCKKLID